MSSSNGHSVTPRIIVMFRNDDPSALSDLEHEREIFALFERAGVPQTLGLVPHMTVSNVRDPHGSGEKALDENPEMAAFLKNYLATSGSEAALHGFTHRTSRRSQPVRREYFEFRELSVDEQEKMIRTGTDTVERALGVRPRTFIPPWNRFDAQTVVACARAGYERISAGPYVPVRDGLAGVGTNASLAGFAEAYARAKKSAHRVFISILFHSSTVCSAEEKALLAEILQTVRGDAECAAMTIAQAARAFPEEWRLANEAGQNIAALHDLSGSVRARAWLYLNASAACGALSGVPRLLQQARDLYLVGEYESCRALTPALDHACARLVWVARGGVALTGVLTGGLLHLLAARSESVSWWPLLTGLLPLAAGLAFSRRAIGAGTRAELTLLSWLVTAALLAGFLAGRFFS